MLQRTNYIIMKAILKPIAMIASAIAIISCGSAESAPVTPADALLDRLEALVEQGKIMYGHQESWRMTQLISPSLMYMP